MAENTNDPSVVSPAVSEMRSYWDVITPLLGGTKAMRTAGQKLLPKFPSEDAEDYKVRLSQATLLPVFKETINNMQGRVFAEKIQLGDDVDSTVKDQCENVDLQGNSIESWVVDWFIDGLSYGMSCVLIDCPTVEGLKTKKDEKDAGVRPYAVLIKPEQLLGWKTKVIKGAKVLSQFRYMETVIEDNGEFDSKQINQVRVLGIGTWQTWRFSEQDQAWYLYDDGANSLDYIPILTFYTGRTGFMTAIPPLMDVAYLNVKHWQSQSDQDSLLHVARVPILAVIGLDSTSNISIGAGSLLRLDDKQCDAKYVEHSGKAIEAGRVSLKDLVIDMIMAGAKLIKKDSKGNKTVSESEEDVAESTSLLQTMAEKFEDVIDQVLQVFADWQGIKKGGNCEVRGNFSDDGQDSDKDFLLAMCESGCLSKETLFSEIQRRGIISDEYKWDDEAKKLPSDKAKVVVET